MSNTKGVFNETGTAYSSLKRVTPGAFVGSMLLIFVVFCVMFFCFLLSSFCILCSMLVVSMNCPLFIVPSILSDVIS